MNSVATPATATSCKKRTKGKKPDKDLTPEERRAESDKRAGRREAHRAQAATTELEEEQIKANARIIN
jgi:hypothetical protein